MKGESDETGTDAGSPFFEPDRTGPEHRIAENAETGDVTELRRGDWVVPAGNQEIEVDSACA